MRGEFLDFDPITGLAEYYEETSDGKGHIHTYQDVEPHLDAVQRLRNSGSPDDVWKKDGVSMYASVPMIVVMELMKKGINIFDQNHLPQVLKEINTNYKYLKTTYKHHAI